VTLFTHSILKACFLSLTAILASFQLAIGADDPYIITHYMDEHGLPQNSIKGIGQDNLGFIWLISEKGPIRYDGRGEFKTFNDLSTALRTIRMSALYSGEQPDELLAKSEYGELVLLKNGKAAVPQKIPQGIASNFALYYPENVHYNLSLPSPYQTDIPSHVFVPDGLEGGFIVSRDSISRIGEDGKPSNAVYFPNASPWDFAGYQGKLIYFDKTLDYVEIGSDFQLKKKKISGDILQLPHHTRFRIYWNTASNQLFIYAASNLYRLAEIEDGNLHSSLLLTGFDFVKNDIITAYYLESQEQLMIGSMTKGLFVIKQKQFRSIGIGDQYSSTVYYNQTLLPNGLLATDRGVTFDSNGRPRFSPVPQLSEPKYGQILGPDGNLWVLQPNKILVVSSDLERVIETKPFPASPRVALKDDLSNYWFGSEGGLLSRYDIRGDTFYTEALFPSTINFLEQKSEDEMLVGTNEGLFVFNRVNRRWQETPFFTGKQIRSIRNESDHRYWITTYQHGFFLYEDGKTTAFPLDESRYLATAHCTMEDRNGFVWISTNNGLFKVSKLQLIAYSRDPKKEPFYFYYDKHQRFNTNEFNGGCEPCAIELPSGQFSFPSLDGLVQFDPSSIIDEFPSRKIILDEVLLDGTTLVLADTITIPHYFSRLDVKVATPFYSDPYNIKIEYQLSSNTAKKSNDWFPLSVPQNTLSINELSSGIQEIRLRMRNGIGEDDFHFATFHLYIQPLFYETWWFTALFCIGIGVMIWLLIYLRTQFILGQNRWLHQKVNERTDALKSHYEWQQRISTSITHDIKAPLNYIVKALSNMQETAKAEGFLPREMEQVYLSTKNIYHYSNNLTKLAKLMLTKDILKFTDVLLYRITQLQIDIFQSVAESRGNIVHNDIPIDTAVRSHSDILSIIIHNLLDNAIKFTQNGEIKIKIEQRTTESILLSITDTGVGLYPEQIDYYNRSNQRQLLESVEEKNIGFGLLLVKDMARLIGAEMTVHSILGKGTTISFILPQTMHVNGVH